MTAVAYAQHSTQPAPRPLPPPFPTPKALALEATRYADLEKVFIDGTTPDLDALVGWEFRGINQPAWASTFGIKKFVKGFYRAEDGRQARVMGYNTPVQQNVLDGRWHTKPKRFGFYEVAPVDATARDNTYLHAVLLDYGKGGNAVYDPMKNLRDYVVSVGGDPDLYLGKAYYAVGPARIATNFFILERFRRGLTDYARR